MISTRLCVLAAALVVTALAAAPALAVTNGQADGDRHPNVGALVVDLPATGPAPVCSGTLIAPSVFLTAAHCVAWLPSLGITSVSVSFDSALDPDRWTRASGVYRLHPNFRGFRGDDVAVVLLSRAVEGVAPAALPPARLLDQLAAKGGLRDQSFTAVGYGFYARQTGGGPPQFLYDGVRRTSISPYAALTAAQLRLLTNENATGEGGVCYGDSGGPQFLGDSSTLVAVTSGGDAACAGLAAGYRLDTPSAREFLGRFVALP